MTASNESTEMEIFNESVRFNKTILQLYDLVFYTENSTLSNSSACYYIQPPTSSNVPITIYDNGTILPAPKSCSDPVLRIRLHAILGIVFGGLFCALLVWTIANLEKFGYLHRNVLRRQNFESVRNGGGRRHHYLMILTAVVGMWTGFQAIDVDRAIVPGRGFLLQSIGYSLLQPFMLVALYEAVRYWMWEGFASLETGEDAFRIWNRFTILITPLFYVLDAAGLLLITARDWNDLTRQWHAEQTEDVARPAAMDTRFRVGYILLAVCMLIIACRILTSWMQYRKLSNEHRRLLWDRLYSLTMAMLPALISTSYNVTSTYVWRGSPYNANVGQGVYYLNGILHVAIVLFILNLLSIGGPRARSGVDEEALRPSMGRRSFRKPVWSRRSRVQEPNERVNTLTLDAIRHIRGREENYEQPEWRWWWQDRADVGPSEDQATQSVVQLDVVTKGQDQAQNIEPGVVSFQTTGNSSPSIPDYRLQRQKGQGMVKSMLDV